jgi:hypothetical protein
MNPKAVVAEDLKALQEKAGGSKKSQ